MDIHTRDGIKELTKMLKEKTQNNPNFRVEDNLGNVFMKLVAQNLAYNHGIYYVDAVRISTSMNVETEVLMEEDDPMKDIDDLAVIYAKFIVEMNNSMYDDETKDIQVMQNFASQMSFKV
jgi:hypothetical protein